MCKCECECAWGVMNETELFDLCYSVRRLSYMMAFTWLKKQIEMVLSLTRQHSQSVEIQYAYE